LDGNELVVHDMPIVGGVVDGSALSELLRAASDGHSVHVFVERAQAMPRQGVKSMFTCGHTFGVTLGVLAALHLPYTIVTAAQWKRAVRVPANKEGARARATELLPAAAHQTRGRTMDAPKPHLSHCGEASAFEPQRG
jgi:hypothetical protein